MSIAAMLDDLRSGWSIVVSGTNDGWELAIEMRDRPGGQAHFYRGPDLNRLVKRAWAGERGDADPR